MGLLVTGRGAGLPTRTVGPGKSGDVIASPNVVSEHGFGCLWWEELHNVAAVCKRAGLSSAKTSLYVYRERTGEEGMLVCREQPMARTSWAPSGNHTPPSLPLLGELNLLLKLCIF